MTNRNSPKSETETLSTTVVVSTNVASALDQFEFWLDNELDDMLQNNCDWHTVNSTRKYFGR